MRHPAVVSLLAITAACQFSEDRYLRRTVSAEELIGNWRATEFAIKSLRDVGVRDHLTVGEHTLVLRADGSCSIQTIMNVASAEYRTYGTDGTGCRWQLGDVGHQALTFELEPAPPGNPYYYFDEEDGRLLLWQYATDPDAWRYMEFEKAGG